MISLADICTAINTIMMSYSGDIEHMSLMKSAIDGIFIKFSKYILQRQIKFFGVFEVCMAISVITVRVGDYGNYTSLISSYIGTLMLFILQAWYELPQLKKFGREYFSLDNINDLVLLINYIFISSLRQ